MKYCLNGRQSLSLLRQADEIRMKYSDIERLIDYEKEMPNKIYIIDIPKEVKEINWTLIEALQEDNHNIVFCLENFDLLAECSIRNIDYYWKYPVTTWYELNALIKILPSPKYVFLGAPLFFDLSKVRSIIGDIEIRVCPNLCYDDTIPRDKGITGTYIRPEDMDSYGKFVNVIDFATNALSKEETLFRIYSKEKKWNGNLNLLLSRFGVDVDNRAIPDEFAEMRMSCGQQCMSGSKCRFCWRAVEFSNLIRKRHFEEMKIKPPAEEEV